MDFIDEIKKINKRRSSLSRAIDEAVTRNTCMTPFKFSIMMNRLSSQVRILMDRENSIKDAMREEAASIEVEIKTWGKK